MRERKKIEKKHLPFLADYIGKKIISLDDFAGLLVDPDSAEDKANEFNEVMSGADPGGIDAWLNKNLTPQAWRTMWLANAGRARRRANPRSEQTIRKDLADDVKAWAGCEDINDAVAAMLKALKKGR